MTLFCFAILICYMELMVDVSCGCSIVPVVLEHVCVHCMFVCVEQILSQATLKNDHDKP